MSSDPSENSALVPTQQVVDDFVAAVGTADHDFVTAFIDQYPNYINARHSGGSTALTSAAGAGQKDMIELLLAKGAVSNTRDGHGKTPLMAAVIGGYLEAVDMLLKNGDNIDAKDSTGWTPLMWAAYAGTTETVRFLLEKGAAYDWVDENAMTADMVARWGGHEDSADLIEQWPLLLRQQKRKSEEPVPVETVVKDLAAERLEKLKNQRPAKSPFKRNQP